jgi:hypothetical protein
MSRESADFPDPAIGWRAKKSGFPDNSMKNNGLPNQHLSPNLEKL